MRANSVSIGPPSERPETAAVVNEAAVWLVRDERLLDVAGDDRIQSKGAPRWSMNPDRPRSAQMHGIQQCGRGWSRRWFQARPSHKSRALERSPTTVAE